MKTRYGLKWIRWAPLLMLAGLLAACQPAVTPESEGGGGLRPDPAPAKRATCDDSAIRLLDLRRAGFHGAIVADTLHMGGAEAPVTCAAPANLSLLAGLSMPDDRTAQVRQSQYYLIVIGYPGGNRLYVISRRGDGTTCVVDTNDVCIAQVTDLPDDFDLETLPDDVEPTIPAGRPAPTVGPPPGGDDTPPAPGDDTPPAPGPPPGDGAPPGAAGTPPGAASDPQPSDGATGVTYGGPLLSWAAAPRALSYDVYLGAENTDLDTPINTSFTALRIADSADLAAGTLYYWRVDAKNEAGATRGSVWSFTTADQAAPAPVVPTGGYTPPVVPPAGETPRAGTQTLFIPDHSFAEGDGPGRGIVEVRLSGLPEGRTSYEFGVAFKEGTVTFGDYPAEGHDVGIPRGLRRAFVDRFNCRERDRVGDYDCVMYRETFGIHGDEDKEENETFQIILSPDVERYGDEVTCGRCTATITIVDDD